MSNKLKIAITILLLAGAVWAYQLFGTATMTITSEPPGAIVVVDGRQRGATPVEGLDLDPGGHRIEVSHTHYRPHVIPLRVSRGDHLERHLRFEPGEGTFEFISNPRGAWVEVDGVRLSGRAPMQHVVSSGPHEIVMGDHERRLVVETHVVNHGESKEVRFDLNIDPHGSVTFSVSPAGAEVEFIGTDIDYRAGVRLPIGEYPVRISKRGYVPEEFRYTVNYGDNQRRITLNRDKGELRVVASPTGTTINVTYRDGGRSYDEDYAAGMKIPVGPVQVRARAMGHRTALKALEIGNRGATLRFALEPIEVTIGEVLQDRLPNGGVGPELVVVPPGSFLMGNAAGPPSENPVREVLLTQPFAVSRYEITVEQYVAFARATGREVSAKVDMEKPTHPMTRVTHDDATAYADWLSVQTGNSYRLLSEAEWEYAARAGSQADYFFGDDVTEICRYGNVADKAVKKNYRDWTVVDCDDGMIRHGPVGSFQANAFGLHDIYGNVSEWILDCSMPSYRSAPTDGSAVTRGISCETHGHRGGSWDSSAQEASSPSRNAARSANDDRGIRIMRDI